VINMNIKIATEKKMFEAYEEVRKSGLTNMFDVKMVIKLAREFSNVVFTREDVTEIMKNYSELKAKYS